MAYNSFQAERKSFCHTVLKLRYTTKLLKKVNHHAMQWNLIIFNKNEAMFWRSP